MPASGQYPPPQPQRRSFALPVVLGLLVAIALVVGVVMVVPGDDDDEGPSVVLEPISHSQTNDFFGNLDVALASGQADQAVADLGTALDNVAGLADAVPVEDEIQTTLSGAGVAGEEDGLYGGSRDDAVCDIAQLTEFLTDQANADKAAVWAGVLGIETADIEEYLTGLTPVRLRYDTRVTNHGFEDGEATPFQSVLQAGTAVLVDDTGLPVVKCNCGNPLGPPEELEGAGDEALDIDALAENPEAAWEALDPSSVVTVSPAAEALEVVTVIDLETGDLLERPVGTTGESDRGTGAFQATLEWTSTADLDLHVTDPNGVEIYYSNDNPADSEGWLDRDANVGCPDSADPPLENIFWPVGAAPSGAYTVEVNGFSVGYGTCGDGAYTLTISVAGQEDQVHTGSVSDGDTDSYTVTVD